MSHEEKTGHYLIVMPDPDLREIYVACDQKIPMHRLMSFARSHGDFAGAKAVFSAVGYAWVITYVPNSSSATPE